jgi:hypothetical protein
MTVRELLEHLDIKESTVRIVVALSDDLEPLKAITINRLEDIEEYDAYDDLIAEYGDRQVAKYGVKGNYLGEAVFGILITLDEREKVVSILKEIYEDYTNMAMKEDDARKHNGYTTKALAIKKILDKEWLHDC